MCLLVGPEQPVGWRQPARLASIANELYEEHAPPPTPRCRHSHENNTSRVAPINHTPEIMNSVRSFVGVTSPERSLNWRDKASVWSCPRNEISARTAALWPMCELGACCRRRCATFAVALIRHPVFGSVWLLAMSGARLPKQKTERRREPAQAPCRAAAAATRGRGRVTFERTTAAAAATGTLESRVSISMEIFSHFWGRLARTAIIIIVVIIIVTIIIIIAIAIAILAVIGLKSSPNDLNRVLARDSTASLCVTLAVALARELLPDSILDCMRERQRVCVCVSARLS